MLLEKREDSYELSAKQLVIHYVQFSLVRRVMNKMLLMMLMLLVAKLGIYVFFVSSNSYPGSSLIKFYLERSKNQNQYQKRVVQVVSCQIFPEICIKSKNIVSLHLSFQKNGMIYSGLEKVQSSTYTTYDKYPQDRVRIIFSEVLRSTQYKKT